MNLNEMWMGNAALNEQGKPPSYLDMPRTGYEILIQRILYVQQ